MNRTKPIKTAILFLPSIFAMTLVVTAADSAKQETREKHFSIAFVNDIHAQLEPHPELYWSGDDAEREMRAGGLSRIKTAFDQLESERPNRLLKIDGGDTFQGSGPGAWTEGEVMVRPLNALGLDMAIPGNWSVVYGAKQLRNLRDQLEYPMIAANIFDEESGERTFAPTLIKEVNGVKIGIVGFTDPDVPTRQPPFMSKGLTFRASEQLQPQIDKLRNQDEVDVIVLVSHIGLHKAVPLSAKLKGVDIHLSADTHERTYEPIVVGETWVVEAGAFASLVGVMDVTLVDGKITDRKWELIELRERDFPEAENIKKIVDEVLAPHRERMNREIGHTDVWLERYNVMTSSMDRLIADAVKDAANVDVGLSNGYRFSPPTAPGTITEADLWNWLPIVLDLKTGVVTGQQFVEYWESEFENVFSANPDRLFGGWLARPSTNMHVEFDSTANAGERLRSLTIDGKPIDLEKDYSLAAGSRTGQPEDQIHRMKHCRRTDLKKETTHDAVREFLSERGDVKETGDPPVQCVVRGNQLRSQYQAFIKERQRERQQGEATSGEMEVNDQAGTDQAGSDQAGNDQPATDRAVIGLTNKGPVKAVYQVSADQWKNDVGKQFLYLKKLHQFYIKQNIDKENIDIRAVLHGDASYHVLTDEAYNRVRNVDTGNPNTKIISELKRLGVHVELCNTRRQEEGWSKSDIHHDVLLVEGAFARLIDLQQQGYSYIKF